MSNDKIVAQLKGDEDDKWLVFHGNTVEEVAAQVAKAEADGLFVTVGRAAEAFRNHVPAGAVIGAAVKKGRDITPVANRCDIPGTCPHGVRIHKESKPGAAKKWEALMCPVQICRPEWI